MSDPDQPTPAPPPTPTAPPTTGGRRRGPRVLVVGGGVAHLAVRALVVALVALRGPGDGSPEC
ncbi:hypothetical protein ACJ5H2_19380 [Nocardioides sp. R1-1]|uniref:hypothetical protein n=1 Tax=Nocardioides sp. R1-1 TaxID=3383502 RepID=UPI0038D07270